MPACGRTVALFSSGDATDGDVSETGAPAASTAAPTTVGPACSGPDDCPGGECVDGRCVPSPCADDRCCGDPCCGDPCCGDPCCDDPCCDGGCDDEGLIPDFRLPPIGCSELGCPEGEICSVDEQCLPIIVPQFCPSGAPIQLVDSFEVAPGLENLAPTNFDSDAADELGMSFTGQFSGFAIANVPEGGAFTLLEDAPQSVAFGDVVGDATADALLMWGEPGDATLWVGEGNAPLADFFEVSQTPLAVSAGEIVVGQFNDDGQLDVAYRTYSDAVNVRVLFGDGLGGFSLAAVGTVPSEELAGIAATDLSGDGLTDLVLSEQSGKFALWLASPDGDFVPGEVTEPIPLGVGRRLVTGQGIAGGPEEIWAVGTVASQGVLTRIVSLDPGEIVVPPPFAVPDGAVDLATFDFNADGLDEVAVATQGLITILSLEGQPCTWTVLGEDPIASLAGGDWNGDGLEGLAAAGGEAGLLELWDAP